MARSKSVPGEKALFWVGSAKDDLLDFPEAVKDAIGLALSVAQFGGKHPNAKPWKGIGPGVLEVVADHKSDTLPCSLRGKVRGCSLRAACLSEEIAHRQKNGSEGRGTDLPKT
jgi:hypothetical protein